MSIPSSAAAAASLTNVETDANATRTFTTLYIPADTSQPLAEWKITYNNATEVSCLMDRMKRHFAGLGISSESGTALRESVRKQITEAFAKQPNAEQKPVSDEMIDMVLQMSSVDCVPLQNNKSSTNFIGLMMYVDDQGKAKNLPVNPRATQTTIECGIPTQVLGDVLIARNFDNDTNFRRIDFTLDEYTKETQWKVDALKANKEKNSSDAQEKTKQIQQMIAAKTNSMQQAAAVAAAAGTSSSSASSLPKACSYAGCDKDGSLRCSRCKRSQYCSAECQKKDWKFHKANVCLTKDELAKEQKLVQEAAQ